MLKKYSNEKFKDVINTLKELPQISAPVDFEINLKRKINTIEPLPLPKRERYYEFSKSLVPAFGLSMAIFLIFLIVSNQNSSEFQNPFLKPPVPRSVTEILQSEYSLKNEMKISENDVVIEEQPIVIYQPKTTAKRSSRSSEYIADEKSSRFIDLISSTTDENNVDKSLSARPGSGTDNYNAPSTANFNGFNIIQDEDQVMEKLRARMDSLKKMTKEKK